MTLDEACTMAAQIREHYRRLDVLAIGRFCLPAELDTTPERWGVSVRIDGGDERTVIWSREKLLGYSAPEPTKRTATPKKKKPVEETDAPLLF